MNPYDNNIKSPEEFLRLFYALLRKNISILIEIEKSKKRNKLSLPKIKEKFEVTKKILDSLIIMQDNIIDKEEYAELFDILNYIGLEVSKGNVSESEAQKHYNNAFKVVDTYASEVPEYMSLS